MCPASCRAGGVGLKETRPRSPDTQPVTTRCSSPMRTSSPTRSWRPRRLSGSPLTSTSVLASRCLASPPVATTPASLSSSPSRITSPRIVISRGIALLDDAEDLADAAHEQPLVLDLDPHTRGAREHDMVARLDRHLEVRQVRRAVSGGEHDALVGRQVVRPLRDEQARL